MMEIHLLPIHYVYLTFILFIMVLLIRRRDTSIVCILGIIALGFLASDSISASVSGIFGSFIYAAKELISTIFIISIVVAMSRVLVRSGINEIMVAPFTKLIRTPAMAYWGIGIIMLFVSLFFWPSPGVALIGAVMLPVAIRVGLPAIGAAMAMNLFGHGIALSGDYVIQGAPKLTADAAGLPVSSVLEASVPLVITMGLVSTVTAYILLRRDMKKGALQKTADSYSSPNQSHDLPTSEQSQLTELLIPLRTKQIIAVIIPVLFALDVAAMYILKLQGSDATALIGGTAVIILIAVTLIAHKNKGLEETTEYLIEGFQFGFRVFGPVIPIAAFFYLGDAALTELFHNPLPDSSHGIVNDLGVALAHIVPLNETIGAVIMTIVGAITGMDGSGFSGISLVGSVAQMFSASIGSAPLLTALGQIAGIWVGGGTLIPWALIPAAAICNVSPFELARRNLIPVLTGLTVTTIVAVLLM